MSRQTTPETRDLVKFYSARWNWRNRGEEHMRWRKATTLAQVPPEAAVLDIGSRNGDLRHYLPAAVKYQGIDIAPEFAAPHVLIRDITAGIPFPDASFDFVFCIEVLEHVPSTYNTMKEIHRVLRPGGKLLASVPNPYHAKEIIWNVLRVPDRQGHIYSWTRQTMTRLGSMAGFRLTGFGGTYFYPPIPMFALLARSIVYRFIKS